MDITREAFIQGRHPRFGEANPQRMRVVHWEWMVREGYGPSQVRQQLGAEQDQEEGPDWCFDRMGATRTVLVDERVVCIGGEHEDWYDPDFCIYNDVVVLGPSGKIEIYGYPKDVLSPTDFHSATLVGGRIILIGCLGYQSERLPGITPVYSLDLTTYRVERVQTQGERPGWIFNHEAEFDPIPKAIIVRGGETFEIRGQEESIRWNVEEYRLLLDDARWERLTDRQGWRQFVIKREDGKPWFPSAQFLQNQVLHPRRVPFETLPELDWRTYHFAVEGVCIRLLDENWSVRILVEGNLPEEVVRRVIEDIRANIQEATAQRCRVVEM